MSVSSLRGSNFRRHFRIAVAERPAAAAAAGGRLVTGGAFAVAGHGVFQLMLVRIGKELPFNNGSKIFT